MKDRIPKSIERFLKKLEMYEKLFSASHDFSCEYERISMEKGRIRAYRWLLWNALSASVSYTWLTFKWSFPMLKNYLKITFRNFKRNKVYSFMNIGGLAIGIACCTLIMLYVFDELSFDKYHSRADRIYRVVFGISNKDYPLPTNANGSFGVGPALKTNFPAILEQTRICNRGQNVKIYVGFKEKKFYETGFFFAEPSLFRMFDFPLLTEGADKTLSEPNRIILTESSARKYFGSEDPVGKTIEADPYNDGNLMQFMVTGVMKDVPRNSHFHPDMLASFCTQKEDLTAFTGIYWNYTYVLLADKAQSGTITPKKLLGFLRTNWTDEPWYKLSFQPLRDIHLHSRLRSEIEPNGSIVYVYVFTAVALFILIIACINFMNLTTARSIKRAKEVGLRKVVGAAQPQLIRQFLGESLFLSGLAAFLALFFIVLVLPLFNNLTGKWLTTESLLNPLFMVGILGLSVTVGLISGIYPAFILASFRPIHSLKSRHGNTKSGTFLRKGLVSFQYTLSIGIICATFVALKQIHYLQNINPGFDKDQILVIPLNKDLRAVHDSFRSELLKHPGFENASTSSMVPTQGSRHLAFSYEGSPESITQVIYLIDKEFLATYGLQLLSGKNISLPISEEKSSEFLISESSFRESGFTSIEESLGKSVEFRNFKGTVAGVVRDMNIYSYRRHPYPINYAVSDVSSHNYLSVRISTENLSRTLDTLNNVWTKMIPAYPLEYFFLDESFENMHLEDKRMGEVLTVFSILAVLVASLGLLGLASFTAAQKTKEIGIRKVLGASSSRIFTSLAKDFLMWVGAGNIIAWPLAYYAMHQWLRNFVYQTSIDIGRFVLAGVLTAVFSLSLISVQTLKAAQRNPADSLHHD